MVSKRLGKVPDPVPEPGNLFPSLPSDAGQPDSGVARRFARVALPIPVPDLFDYAIPDELDEQTRAGCRVRVPFGRSHRIGYVIERSDTSDYPQAKNIAEVLDDEPLLGAEILELVRWTASYYLAAVGDVIEAAVPRKVREARKPEVRWVRPGDTSDPGAGAGKEKRARILATLAAAGPMPIADLLRRAEVTESSVKTLQKRGALEIYKAAAPDQTAATRQPTSVSASPVTLSEHQRTAVDELCRSIDAGGYQTYLLHGVTGSGKTEVYLQAIARALAHDRSALVLLPEIALTPQTLARFEARFGDVAVLHSMLAAGERLRQYERLRSGQTRVAVGARSAVFAPIHNLGLIVVDESHEPTYKQESSPRYHARDLAVLRASRLSIPCILGTATPTLESLQNVEEGRYTCLSLPHRVTRHTLATVELIDRRIETISAKGSAGLFSPKLVDVLSETLDRGEQALLFLNRRGFARNVHCPCCGYAFRCDDCDIGLTYHRRDARSLCHYCGRIEHIPDKCPECHHPGLRRTRPGTERIEDFLETRFPDIAIGRLDRDTATSAGRLERILADFRDGNTRILIGTQMVAKGHDIPGVTLVGVLDADVALELPDFRAAERTCQLLLQVSGRAGRGDKPGRVLIQTRRPDHYAIEAAVSGDMTELYRRERSTRRLLGYPPFGHLVRVLCEDASEERAVGSAEAIARALPTGPTLKVLGPSPAPLSRLRGRYRYHLLVKSPDRGTLGRAVRPLAFAKARWSTTRVVFDVDPQSLL